MKSSDDYRNVRSEIAKIFIALSQQLFNFLSIPVTYSTRKPVEILRASKTYEVLTIAAAACFDIRYHVFRQCVRICVVNECLECRHRYQNYS